MAHWPTRFTPLDRFFNRFTRLRPGEGRSIFAFFSYALLMMVSYYILKTVREPLLLTGSSAEMKSYAYATIATLLLFIVPLYGWVFRHTSKQQLTRYITLFFLACMAVFYVLGRAGMDVAFSYYVWVGIFAVMVPTQFWAFAADSYNVKTGKRLFPVVMVGATLGGLAAPSLSGALFPTLGPWNLLLLAMALLALTLPCVGWARNAVPPGSQSVAAANVPERSSGFFGGFALVFSDVYLLLLAILIVLLNWVNTTGEYILAEAVVRHADALVVADPGVVKSDYIASFYGRFFFTVNLFTMLAQVFLVARVIQRIGIRGAVLVLPLVTLIGYWLIVFFPLFSVIRLVKLVENSTDYSLMNTTRHALYLPLASSEKYEGKTTIEAFFWRFGDLAQAGVIFAGLNWFDFDIPQFAMLNMFLSMVWFWVAWLVARNYGFRQEQVSDPQPPRRQRKPPDQQLSPGRPFAFELSSDTFSSPDEGDVMIFSAVQKGMPGLPEWLHFEAETLGFSGTAPHDLPAETVVLLRATDFDGAWAESALILRRGDD